MNVWEPKLKHPPSPFTWEPFLRWTVESAGHRMRAASSPTPGTRLSVPSPRHVQRGAGLGVQYSWPCAQSHLLYIIADGKRCFTWGYSGSPTRSLEARLKCPRTGQVPFPSVRTPCVQQSNIERERAVRCSEKVIHFVDEW